MNEIRLIVFFLVVMTLGACTKDSASELMYDSTYDTFASVSIFNTIPKSDGLVISIGHSREERNMLAASDQVKFGGYFGYRNWYSGHWDLFVESREANKVESNRNKLFLQNRKSYSLFVYRDNSIQQVLTEDNVISPKEGTIKIRLAHFLEGLDRANVYLPDLNIPLFSQVKFAQVTDFIELDPKSINNFKIMTEDGQIELLYNDDRKFADKGIYTILLKGSLFNGNGKENQDFIRIIKQY